MMIAVTHAEIETAIITEEGDAHAHDHDHPTATTALATTGTIVTGETAIDALVNMDAAGMTIDGSPSATARHSLRRTSGIAARCLSSSLPPACVPVS